MAPVLTLLGTGTPAPLTHRAGSSYLLELAGEKLLIDCGPEAVHRLLETGISPTEIAGLFLTHLHYDHCVDYAYFNLLRWDQGVGQIPELEVWGPAPLARMTESLLGAEGAFGPDLAARTEHPGSHFIYEMRGGTMPRGSTTFLSAGCCIEKCCTNTDTTCAQPTTLFENSSDRKNSR